MMKHVLLTLLFTSSIVLAAVSDPAALKNLAQKISTESPECDIHKNEELRVLGEKKTRTGALQSKEAALQALDLLGTSDAARSGNITAFESEFLASSNDDRVFDALKSLQCPLFPRFTVLRAALLTTTAKGMKFSREEQARIFKAVQDYIQQPSSPRSSIHLMLGTSILRKLSEMPFVKSSKSYQKEVDKLQSDLKNQSVKLKDKYNKLKESKAIQDPPESGTSEQKQAFVAFVREENQSVEPFKKRLADLSQRLKMK
jgi:hypothetical protein